MLPAVAPWFKPGSELVLNVRGDWLEARPPPVRCVPLHLTARSNGALWADLEEQSTPSSAVRCHTTLVLGNIVVLFPLSCTTDGMSTGGGEPQILGFGFELSSADEHGLVYENVPLRVKPACQWLYVDQPGCPEQSCRTCRIVVKTHAHGANATIEGVATPDLHVRVGSPSCSPCLPDRQEQLLPRLSAVLRDRDYVRVLDGPGTLHFFRGKADCEVDLRAASKATRP